MVVFMSSAFPAASPVFSTSTGAAPWCSRPAGSSSVPMAVSSGPGLREELGDRLDGQHAGQPPIEGGQIGAGADLAVLLLGHREAALLQDDHQRLGLPLGIGPAVRFS